MKDQKGCQRRPFKILKQKHISGSLRRKKRILVSQVKNEKSMEGLLLKQMKAQIPMKKKQLLKTKIRVVRNSKL